MTELEREHWAQAMTTAGWLVLVGYLGIRRIGRHGGNLPVCRPPPVGYRTGMPRAIWSGSISFGLVNAPVKMYSAIDEHDLELHLVHEKDGSRIGYQKICKKEGREVPADEIVKAYEVDDGDLVYLTDEDFEAAEEESYRAIEILDFVPYDQIDSIVFQRTYYLGPVDAYLLDGYANASGFNSGYGAVNRIKVIVQGPHAWLIVNGEFMDDFALDARLSNAANGFAMVIYRYGPNSQAVTKFGFRNLVIREVN